MDNIVSTADVVCGRIRSNWEESGVPHFNILERDAFERHRDFLLFYV
jgi:hypothetical protein